MKVTRKDVGDATVLSVKGSMTLSGEVEKLSAVTSQLAQEGRQKVVLDLSEVAFVDSAGLGELARSFTALARQGGRLVLGAPTRSLRNSLAITKLETVLQAYDSVDEALLALQSDSVADE